MRFRHIALGCVLTGGLGFLAMPPATALADGTGPAVRQARARQASTAVASKPVTPLAKAKPQISVSSPVTDNPYGAEVTLTVTLGPTVADRRVALYATPFGQARKRVAAGAVNAERKWYARYRITRATTFTAVFAGGPYNAPNSASTDP